MRFRHYLRLLLFALSPLLLLNGCSAVSSTQGEATVYKNSVPHVLGLTAIGIAFLVFGVGIARESYQKTAPAKRQRSAKRSRKRTSKSSGLPTGVFVGSGLTLIGLIIVVLGIPSALLAYVEVGPEKVVLRDKLFWFAYGPRELPYSSISDINHEVVQVLARRGVRKKEYLYITHLGGVERIEMTPIHKAAREHLESAYDAYQSAPVDESEAPIAIASNANNAAAKEILQESPIVDSPEFPFLPPSTTEQSTRSGPSPSSSSNTSGGPQRFRVVTDGRGQPNESEEVLTSIDRIGRFIPGIHVMARDDSGKFSRAEVLEVFQEDKVKVRFQYGPLTGSTLTVNIKDAVPAATSNLPRRGEGPGREITSINELSIGRKVLGQYDTRWYPAEIKGIRGSEPTIQWDGEKSLNTVPLNWVRLPE